MTTTPSSKQFLRAIRHTWRTTNPTLPMIRDAREHPVPLYRLDRLGHTAMSELDLPEAVFARIRTRLIVQSTRGMGGAPAVLLVFAGVQVLFFLVQLGMGSRGGLALWGPLVAATMFAAYAATYRYRIPKIARESIAAAMLAEGRCASCAYDLAAANPDPNGLTTCPECGAAWRVAAAARS